VNEAQQRQAVVDEAWTWLHTAYHHGARVKHVGVDCAQILIGIYSNVGLIEAFDTGPYPHDWHLHRSTERYLGWLSKHAHEVKTPGVGDVVMFKFGRCFAHGAVLVSEAAVIHSYLGTGVIHSRLRDAPLHGRQRQYWSFW
jgi:cell wall-associated NlpC family hydrolase